mmetsp:Transcript_6969/g.12494  ORF Transcript_6969/g.12494 Transcript_6969/m.12494 type:complete len:188 (-) Transcript_6969:1797-2360(-)
MSDKRCSVWNVGKGCGPYEMEAKRRPRSIGRTPDDAYHFPSVNNLRLDGMEQRRSGPYSVAQNAMLDEACRIETGDIGKELQASNEKQLRLKELLEFEEIEAQIKLEEIQRQRESMKISRQAIISRNGIQKKSQKSSPRTVNQTDAENVCIGQNSRSTVMASAFLCCLISYVLFFFCSRSVFTPSYV